MHVCPNFIAQSLFSQIEQEIPDPGEAYRAIFLKRGRSIMRRYVFGAEAISTLRYKFQSSNIDNLDRPISRVEAVSALLWKCFMAASTVNGKSGSVVTHAVNLSRRARPPLPSDCFGNLMTAFATSTTNENSKDIGELACEIRKMLSNIDGDYINRMIGDDGFRGFQENMGRTWSDIINFPERYDLLPISSWCGFDFYEVDFGFGKPVWVNKCCAGNDDPESAFLNNVYLMDSGAGDGGVEAWVILGEKYMKIFDNVEELRAVASTDHNPRLKL